MTAHVSPAATRRRTVGQERSAKTDHAHALQDSSTLRLGAETSTSVRMTSATAQLSAPTVLGHTSACVLSAKLGTHMFRAVQTPTSARLTGIVHQSWNVSEMRAVSKNVKTRATVPGVDQTPTARFRITNPSVDVSRSMSAIRAQLLAAPRLSARKMMTAAVTRFVRRPATGVWTSVPLSTAAAAPALELIMFPSVAARLGSSLSTTNVLILTSVRTVPASPPPSVSTL